MYSFRMIRRAIAAGDPLRPEFPYGVPLEELSKLAAAPHLAELTEELREAAAHARATPAPALPFSLFQAYEAGGTRAEYEQPYFDRRGRLLALTMERLLHKDEDVRKALEDIVWDICGEYTWCLPACLPGGFEASVSAKVPPEQQVDLFAAETAHALAETLFLAGAQLNPWISHRIRSEIERRVFSPLFEHSLRFAWESRADNWSAVCGGAIGMAALLIVADRERLAGMIDRVVRSLECFLEGFGRDGGCAEGIDYWYYGFGYYVYFADMLFQYTGGELDLLKGDNVRAIASFPHAMSLPGGSAVNYSDVRRVVLHPGIHGKLAARLGTPSPQLRAVPPLRAEDCFRWPHITRNLLWSDPNLFGSPMADATRYFEDLAVVVDRRTIDGVAVAFSAKGGHNGEPHNHNDVGQFILHVGGDHLLADPGAGLYSSDSFGERRYELLHNSSEGHSVPSVNGRLQRAGRSFAAEAKRFEQQGDKLAFELEAGRAYDDPDLLSFRRSFEWAWQPPGDGAAAELRLTDTFLFAQRPMELTEQFVSLTTPQGEDGIVVWRGRRGIVVMSYDVSAFETSVEANETKDAVGAPQTIYRLRLRSRSLSPRMTLAFVFRCYPGAAAE